MIISVSELSSVLYVILGFYCLSIICQTVVLASTVVLWKTLPQRFRMLTIASVALIMTGFCVCIWYIVTLNEQADCSIARKVAYSFFYLGFCFYDVYQLYKIKAIVEPGIAVSSVMYGLLAVRFASYVYNITAVTGVVAQISASRISKFGPCTSSFTSISIYQEHIVSLLFESLLAVIFVVYVNSNRSKSMPLSEFVRKIVDFEILSFIIYFVVECLYTVVYTVIDKSMISLLNTFYLNVPIMLFFMNICMFFRKRTQRLKDTSVETAVSSRP